MDERIRGLEGWIQTCFRKQLSLPENRGSGSVGLVIATTVVAAVANGCAFRKTLHAISASRLASPPPFRV
jgi:hypothetical protein